MPCPTRSAVFLQNPFFIIRGISEGQYWVKNTSKPFTPFDQHLEISIQSPINQNWELVCEHFQIQFNLTKHHNALPKSFWFCRMQKAYMLYMLYYKIREGFRKIRKECCNFYPICTNLKVGGSWIETGAARRWGCESRTWTFLKLASIFRLALLTGCLPSACVENTTTTLLISSGKTQRWKVVMANKSIPPCDIWSHFHIVFSSPSHKWRLQPLKLSSWSSEDRH